MSFIQDPRLRQRWNQLSQNAELATENAAAGIWAFQHRYLSPCLGSLGDALDSCTGVCLGGDREERARRARERDRGARRTRAEYMFDFYDDWDDPDSQDEFGASMASGVPPGSLLGSWGGQDWDRLLAGTGHGRIRHGANVGDVVDQPRTRRGMSYGTRSTRRKVTEEDNATIIPSTAPLGFLGRLPFKIGGPLRYKPSAANLKEHPSSGIQTVAEETMPLLGTHEDYIQDKWPRHRQRSNTAGSGETSSSCRSRGDLFPSDEEGEADAIPLDDEFSISLATMDDLDSDRTRSSKGKRPADGTVAHSVSRITLSSTQTRESAQGFSSVSVVSVDGAVPGPSLDDLQQEEEAAAMEEVEEILERRRAAARLAQERGLARDESAAEMVAERKADVESEQRPESSISRGDTVTKPRSVDGQRTDSAMQAVPESDREFVPARLPHF